MTLTRRTRTRTRQDHPRTPQLVLPRRGHKPPRRPVPPVHPLRPLGQGPLPGWSARAQYINTSGCMSDRFIVDLYTYGCLSNRSFDIIGITEFKDLILGALALSYKINRSMSYKINCSSK